MAQFQTTHYHEDETPKRPLCTSDIDFLKGLQKELNTQDNMGNRDPRFWVIRQQEERIVPEGYEDTIVIYDTEDSDVFGSVEGFLSHLEMDDKDSYDMLQAECLSLDDMTDIINTLSCDGNDRYEIRYICHEEETVQDTLFLTHRDCEDYLRTYGYNHKPDAHAYAMTAVRSPRYEQLIGFLRTVDLEHLSALLEKEGQDNG